MVLTHDVETESRGATAWSCCGRPSANAGYRSSWNFVPERYEVDPRICVRGSARTTARSAFMACATTARTCDRAGCSADGCPAMRASGRRAGGLWASDRRPPSAAGTSCRSWASRTTRPTPTPSRTSPQPGGCCTYWPFFNDDLVELPITLPQDHTLFEILGHATARSGSTRPRDLATAAAWCWCSAHPDYATDARRRPGRPCWTSSRTTVTAWQALPREVAAWWRARSASADPAKRRDDGRSAGPAAGVRRCLSHDPPPHVAAGQS